MQSCHCDHFSYFGYKLPFTGWSSITDAPLAYFIKMCDFQNFKFSNFTILIIPKIDKSVPPKSGSVLELREWRF